MQNLKPPNLMFISCFGSYYVSIFNDVGLDYKNLLLYLNNCNLKFKKEKKNTDNPWKYQNLKIYEGNSDHCLKINNYFFEFLNNKFNIKTKKISLENEENFIEKYIDNLGVKEYCIIQVDESKLKRKTIPQNNKHYLLVKSKNDNLKIIDVIDSEYNKSYKLTYDQLMNSVYNNSFYEKRLYLIDCKNIMINKISINYDEKFIYTMFENSKNLILFYIDVLVNLNKKDELVFKGFRYNLVSKIIPYLLYRCTFCENIISEKEPAYSWVYNNTLKLNNIMNYKILKLDLSYSSELLRLIIKLINLEIQIMYKLKNKYQL